MMMLMGSTCFPAQEEMRKDLKKKRVKNQRNTAEGYKGEGNPNKPQTQQTNKQNQKKGSEVYGGLQKGEKAPKYDLVRNVNYSIFFRRETKANLKDFQNFFHFRKMTHKFQKNTT